MTDNYSFSVILEPQEEGGFTVLVPALPEVVTEGDSEEEALANAEEAIRAILAYRRDNGIPIPSDAHPEIRRALFLAKSCSRRGLACPIFAMRLGSTSFPNRIHDCQ